MQGAGRLSPVPEGPGRGGSLPVKQQQQRSTFPAKFHGMLQQAQESHIKAAHQLQDRRSLSVAMLVAGRAQAFVDFFMLSQPDAGRPELPWQSMVLLQEQLVRADAAIRSGDVPTAFDAHRTLAKHFTQLGILENAVFFWKKCLQVCFWRWQPNVSGHAPQPTSTCKQWSWCVLQVPPVVSVWACQDCCWVLLKRMSE
jgi:hypothetical protein